MSHARPPAETLVPESGCARAALPGGIQAEQQPGCPQPGRRQDRWARGHAPCPAVLPPRAMTQLQPPVNFLPALGTISSIFGAEQDGALYGPEKGGGGGRRVLSLPPSAVGPCREQHVHTGRSSRFMLGAVGLCWAVPSLPAPAQRGGHAGMQRPPVQGWVHALASALHHF